MSQHPIGRDLHRHVRVDWTPTRAHRAEQGLSVRRRRKMTRTTVLVAAAAGALALALWPSHDEPTADPPEVRLTVASPAMPANPPAPAPRETPAPPPPVQPRIKTLALAKGATATPLVEDAALRVVGDTPERTVVALDAGAAEFEIARSPGHAFRLVAPRARRDITIDVVAAKFAVVRETQRVRIEVYDGLLSVRSEEGVRELGRGATYDLSAAPKVVAKREVVVVEPAAIPPTSDALDELLVAADQARHGGHREEAVVLLRRALRDHAGDARAPLAAFTLGRVLLQLERAGEAAEAFATVDRLAPTGPMAQDALARQVEALAAAGNASEARTVAQAYVTRFPDGRRLAEVRKWGAL